MPQEPKKRHSRARQGKRRHALKLTHKNLSLCANCGNKHISHTVCRQCGFYRGKQVTKVPSTTDQTKSQTQTPSAAKPA